MKKTLSILLILATLLGIVFAIPMNASGSKSSSSAPAMGTFEEIYASYNDPQGRPMSCAHRAISYIGTPIPENSLQAIQACIDAKVDIVELDIQRTSDGVYVLSHDQSIKRCTTYNTDPGKNTYRNISGMTWDEIKQYEMLEYTGNNGRVWKDENGKSYHIPTFEEALAVVKDHCMINLDKFESLWSRRMEIYDIVYKAGCVKNVMFKGGTGTISAAGLKQWHSEIKAKYGEDAELPCFCTLISGGSSTYVQQCKDYAAAGAQVEESSFSSFDVSCTNPEYTQQVKPYIRKFANVLTEALNSSGYCAGLPENAVGWSACIALGFSILQTNNAKDCADYIYQVYGPNRDISQGISGNRFSKYKHVDQNTTVSVGTNYVSLGNDDLITFENIDFSNAKNSQLLVQLASSSAGKLSFYIGVPTSTSTPIAEVSLNASTGDNVFVKLAKSVSGTQTIAVKATGLSENQRIQLKSFAIPANGYGKVTGFDQMPVSTTPGVAPKLPAKAVLTTELGLSVSENVNWGKVDSKYYAKSYSMFDVPGKTESGYDVKVTVFVLPFSTADVLVWFDADYGITKNGTTVEKWVDRVNGIAASLEKGTPVYVPTGLSSKNATISFASGSAGLTYPLDLNGKSDLTIVTYANDAKKSTGYMSDYKINNTARYTLVHFGESGSWGSVWLTTFKNGVACRFGSGENDNRGIYYLTTVPSGFNSTFAVKKSTSEKIFLNGNQIYDRDADTSKTSSMGNPGTVIKNTNPIGIIGYGIQSSAPYYYTGEASDIIIFNKALSQDEITAVHGYLNAKKNGMTAFTDYSSQVKADNKNVTPPTPVTTKSVTTKTPVTTKPVTTKPITTKPVVTTVPVTTTAPVTTTEAITTEVITTEVITTEEITTAVITTEVITTVPVTTEEITTAVITTDVKTDITTEEGGEVTTVPVTTAPEKGSENSENEDNKKGIIIASAIVAGLILLLVLVLAFGKRKDKKGEQ